MVHARHDAGLPLVKWVTCPACMHRFSPEDACWIAGDGVGRPREQPEHRSGDVFRATRFDVSGAAVTPGGGRTNRLACPTCLHEVPKACFLFPAFVVSVVGSPGVGKSALVAAMAWRLRIAGHEYVLTDAAPGWNEDVHRLEQQLFVNAAGFSHGDHEAGCAAAPVRPVGADQSAATVRMPAVFVAEPQACPRGASRWRATRVVIVHEYCLGAGAVASGNAGQGGNADLTVFVYDPTQDARFGRVSDSVAPCMPQHAALREAVSGSGDGDPRKRGALVVVVAKADAWIGRTTSVLQHGADRRAGHGEPSWLDAWSAMIPTRTAVAAVSQGVRQFILRIAPEIVALAERSSDQVLYIPTSVHGWRRSLTHHGDAGAPQLSPAPGATWCATPLVIGLDAAPRIITRGRRVSRDSSVSDGLPPRLEHLVRRHRLLAIAGAPLEVRLSVLRRIVDFDPGNAAWRADLREYECVRQDELHRELKSLAKAGVGADAVRAREIVASLADAGWQEPLRGRDIEHVQRLYGEIQAAVTGLKPEPATTEAAGRAENRRNGVTGGEPARRQRLSLAVLVALTVMGCIYALRRATSPVPRPMGSVAADADVATVPKDHGIPEQIAAIDARLDGPLSAAVGTFVDAASDKGVEGGHLHLRLRAARAEIAAVEHDIRALEQAIDASVAMSEGSAQLGHREAVARRFDRLEAERRRLMNSVRRRADEDDKAITAMLDAAAEASNAEGDQAVAAAKRLLEASEHALGVRRDVLHGRVRAIEAARSSALARTGAEARLDKAFAQGFDAFLAARAAENARPAAGGAQRPALIDDVAGMDGLYGVAMAWAEVARRWRPLATCSRDEARVWREAIGLARAAGAQPEGENAAARTLAVLEDHLRVVESDPPRELEALSTYLDLPIMQPDVRQTVFDGRVYYFSDAGRRELFIAEDATKPLDDDSEILKASGCDPATHLPTVAALRRTFRHSLENGRAVDASIASALQLLGDARLQDGMDPILLCRLQADVLRLAARRPLFRDAIDEAHSMCESLRTRLGEQPRWVRSVNWSSANAWRNARTNAASVMPSPESLMRIVDCYEKRSEEVSVRPEFCRDLVPVGWVGESAGQSRLRLVTEAHEGQAGVLLVVRHGAGDAIRYQQIGSLQAGTPDVVSGVDARFGEPVFLEVRGSGREAAAP